MIDNIQIGLQNLGFSEKKIAVFLALLELGEATATEIAKKSRLKRTTVYNLLPEFISEGYVKKMHHKNKQTFYIEDVRSLLIPIEKIQQSFGSLMPQLQAIHNALPFKPKISFYEGETGAIEFWRKTLEVEPGSLIYEIVGPEAFYTKLPKIIADSYVPDRVKRKIAIRIIASDSSATRQLQKKAKAELREIVILPKNTFDAAVLIFGDKLGFISFVENFNGVIIESAAIAGMQRVMFELLWRSLRQM